MMKLSNFIMLGTLLLAACGPSAGDKPAMQQQRDTLEKAKKIDALQQQQAQKQQQEAEKQTQ